MNRTCCFTSLKCISKMIFFISVIICPGISSAAIHSTYEDKLAEINISQPDPVAKQKEMLYVVNGKIMKNDSIKNIDPSQIESVQVLKNESVVKKYGERAKNGVIEITLKKK